MARKSTNALDKAADKFAEQFAKTYGEGVLDRSGRKESTYEVISTGALSLDDALGVGGYVQGRITELWGVEGCGKSTLALSGVREAQKKYPDKPVAWIDMEGTFDRGWAVTHGVDVSRRGLWLITPSSAEEVADQMKDCLRSGLFSMVVLDSIGAMIPEVEKEKDADEAVMAVQAKVVTRMVKIAAVEARNTSTVVLLVNQVRANLSSYGKATTTGGGFALKHCSTHKIELKMGGERFKVQMDGEKRTVGHPIAAMVERNKVAPPFRKAVFNLFHTASPRYGEPGVDLADDVATVAIRSGTVATKGAWLTLPNGDRFQGRPKFVEALRDDPALLESVRLAFWGGGSPEVDMGAADADLDEVAAEVSSEGEDGGSASKFASLTATGMYEEATDWNDIS